MEDNGKAPHLRLLVQLGSALGIPSAEHAAELLKDGVSPHRAALLYPFYLEEWKDSRLFKLPSRHVPKVIARIGQQKLTLHLPDPYRTSVVALFEEYQAEARRLYAVGRAHSMNVENRESWARARYELLTAGCALAALDHAPFSDTAFWRPELNPVDFAARVPGWEAEVHRLITELQAPVS